MAAIYSHIPKAVVLLSGGLDSSTVAAKASSDGYEVVALSFRYGQSNERELQSAKKIADKLNVKEHFIVDIDLAQWSNSSLTVTRSKGEFKSDIIPTTYVPGRNTVFIAIALSLAEVKAAEVVYLGFTAADVIYPDTQAPYLEAFNQLACLSSKAGIAGKAPRLFAPFIKEDKVSIVNQALQMGVPIADTWSCYQEGEDPCGLCSSCRVRDLALIKVGRPDLATFEGRNFYANQIKFATNIFWSIMLRD